MKILIFIEHDITIRHFIHSNVFEKLIKEHDVKFIFPPLGYHKRILLDVRELVLGATYRHLPIHQPRLKILSYLSTANLLRWRPGAQNKMLRQLRRDNFGFKNILFFSIMSLPIIYQCFKWVAFWKLKKTPNIELEAILEEEKPDLIVHPTVLAGVFINELVARTRSKNIPAIFIMNSWDNPSTKSAVVGNPDWLLVWGKQTKIHAIEFMGMPEDQVVSFGAAQFDLYRNQPRISRDDFCIQHNIDPEAKILLYAGSSKDTDEFQHLIKIDHAISDGKLGNTVTVYRPHPWGEGGRGGERLLDHPWKHIRIEESMRTYLERIRAGDKARHMPDYRHTHDVLSSIDYLVSPLSTIIIEGALHGKPVLCFLPEEETEARHFQMISPMVHFQDMYKMPEFRIATGNEQLIPKLQDLLTMIDDNNTEKNLENACKFFVEPFEKSYGERLVEFVESIAPLKN